MNSDPQPTDDQQGEQTPQPGEAYTGPTPTAPTPYVPTEDTTGTSGGETPDSEGSVQSTHDDSLPTETPPEESENLAADQGGPGHTDPEIGTGEPQADAVTTEGNQAADSGGPGHTPPWQGDTPSE